MQHDQDATVAVTGCSDIERNVEGKMFISMMSRHSPYQKTFVINLKDGDQHTASRSKEPLKRQLSEAKQVAEQIETIIAATEVIEGDEVKDTKLEARVSKAPEIGVPCSIKAKIKMGTDASAWHTIQNNLQMTVDNWLAEMFTHVQSHYYHPTLQHRINFEA